MKSNRLSINIIWGGGVFCARDRMHVIKSCFYRAFSELHSTEAGVVTFFLATVTD